jgi:TRAP transporter TAXI family solute receptor
MQRTLIALSIILLVALLWLATNRPVEKIHLGGGPEGGTFLVYARGLAELLRSELPQARISVGGSGGSVNNLINIEKGRVAIALAYAGDAFLGYQGQLKNHPVPLKNVQALARIYGSTAQLVVLKESVVKTPEHLVNRRVAIGSPGSGAAHSAERYFRILGIWEEITPLYLGYDQAMEELISHRAQAVWQLVGAPSASIVKTNRKHPLRLLDLAELADQSEFLLEYPFYTRASIPAETYAGQSQPIDSFQDNTLLVAHSGVDPQLVATLLRLLFSPAGMKEMRAAHPTGRELDPNNGLLGVQIPLHPEAAQFWRERGVLR